MNYFNTSPLSRKTFAYTLIEILVVIAILTVLVILSLGIFRNFRDRADSTHCLSNLRSAGVALFSYAAEHDGVMGLVAYTDGMAGTSVTWLDYLTGKADVYQNRTSGGSNYLEDLSITVCPSFTPYANPDPENPTKIHNRIYGALTRTGFEDNPAIKNPSEMRNPPGTTKSGFSKVLMINMVENPSEHVLLGDSYHASDHWQIYLMNADAKSYGVHLRHHGRANLLFASGHVESATPERLKSIRETPFTQGYDKNEQKIKF